MTNKTTSAIDLVERLYAYDVPNSGSRDGQEFLNEVADTITRLQAALTEIREAVSRRQLPITNQVYEIADSALKSVGGE